MTNITRRGLLKGEMSVVTAGIFVTRHGFRAEEILGAGTTGREGGWHKGARLRCVRHLRRLAEWGRT